MYILFYSQLYHFENTGIFLQIIDPLDLYRASIIRDFILTRRVHLLFALRLVFPTDSPLVTFPLRIIVRLLTIPLQLLINHTLPVQDHVSFLSCTFSSFLFPLLDSKATSFIPPTWDSFLSLFSLRILSRRSIRNLEVQPQVIRFPRNEIDRLRRVNKTSVLDLSPLLLKSKNWIDENWVKRRSIIKERKNHWISFGITCQERSIKLSHHQLSGRRKKKRRENRKENEIQTKREREKSFPPEDGVTSNGQLDESLE